MNVKTKFDLVYDRESGLYNVVPLRAGSLKAFEISKSDQEHVKNLVKIYGRSKNHFAEKIINSQISKCKVINFPRYPLAGFMNKDKQMYVNVGTLPASLPSDYTPADVYSIFLYTIALGGFIKKQPFSDSVEEHVSAYIFSVFMRVFGKRAGLIGSYKNLIPKLRFLIYYYVHIAFFGFRDTDKERKKISLRTGFSDFEDTILDFDFANTKGFIKSINDNKLIPLSENVFSSKIIRMGGVNVLPLFEDLSRFFAIFLAVTVSGNTVFGTYLPKINNELYNKLVYLGTKNLNKIY